MDEIVDECYRRDGFFRSWFNVILTILFDFSLSLTIPLSVRLVCCKPYIALHYSFTASSACILHNRSCLLLKRWSQLLLSMHYAYIHIKINSQFAVFQIVISCQSLVTVTASLRCCLGQANNVKYRWHGSERFMLLELSV